jgi:hypothetical protein
MGRLENNTNIEKVEAVFFEVGKSLRFIPLISALSLCTHFVSTCQEVYRALQNHPPAERPFRIRESIDGSILLAGEHAS